MVSSKIKCAGPMGRREVVRGHARQRVKPSLRRRRHVIQLWARDVGWSPLVCSAFFKDFFKSSRARAWGDSALARHGARGPRARGRARGLCRTRGMGPRLALLHVLGPQRRDRAARWKAVMKPRPSLWTPFLHLATLKARCARTTGI
eukprot:scaffold21395_cov113-Isochrysis_galbana.AAC.2